MENQKQEFNFFVETQIGGGEWGHHLVTRQISDIVHYFGTSDRYGETKIWGKTIHEAYENNVRTDLDIEYFKKNYLGYKIISRNADFAISYFTSNKQVLIRVNGKKEDVIKAIKSKIKKEDFYMVTSLKEGEEISEKDIYGQ